MGGTGGVGGTRAAGPRALRGAAFAVLVLALLAGIVLSYRHAVGPRPLERLSGPVGLPATVYRVPKATPDVRDRPIEAASVVVATGGSLSWGLVSADGRHYRTLAVDAGPARGPYLAPDGRTVAWLEDTTLHVLRLADGHETTRAAPKPVSGALPWFPDRRTPSGHAPHEDVFTSPDGRSWAYVDTWERPGVVVDGRVYDSDHLGGHTPEKLLAWSAEGLWVGGIGDVMLVDPATGRATPSIGDELPRLQSLAAGLVHRGVVVPAPPPPAVWRALVAPILLAAALAGVLAGAVYRTRRIRAMQSPPATARARETTNSAR